MTNRIDHLMFGAADLPTGISAVQQMLGLTAEKGGKHAGLGTENALIGLEDGIYLEVLAADETSPDTSPYRRNLEAVDEPRLIAYILRTSSMADFLGTCRANGVATSGPLRLSRPDPEGRVLEWDLLFFDDPELDALMPIVIDWRDAPHPTSLLSPGGRLERFHVETPHHAALGARHEMLGIPVAVLEGSDDRLAADIATPRGGRRCRSR